MDRTLLDQLRQEEYGHYQFVKAERGGYYKRRTTSVQNQADYMSLIIDGADWYNYALPYWATKTHESSKLFRAPIYLIGVIIMGGAPSALSYLVISNRARMLSWMFLFALSQP